MRVERIGKYSFVVVATDEGYWLQYIDLGRDGNFANILPFQLRDIRDLARHYDDIIHIIDRLPRSGTHEAKDGKAYRYEIRVGE